MFKTKKHYDALLREKDKHIMTLTKDVRQLRETTKVYANNIAETVNIIEDELQIAHERQKKQDAEPSSYMRGLSKALTIIEDVWGAGNVR